jgi:poly-gamma-glutamate synthesis protein (capsule biosynthesis protein)
MKSEEHQEKHEGTLGRGASTTARGRGRVQGEKTARTRLALVGDVMLGRLVNLALRHAPPEYPWGDVLPLLRSADALALNLECVISDLGEPWPGKIFCFRSDAKNVEVLSRAGASAVSLANNHSLDYGSEALRECLALLAQRGIRSAGAGNSLDEARRPAVFPLGADSAALVAFTDNDPEWEAQAASPGTFYAPVDPMVDDLKSGPIVGDR